MPCYTASLLVDQLIAVFETGLTWCLLRHKHSLGAVSNERRASYSSQPSHAIRRASFRIVTPRHTSQQCAKVDLPFPASSHPPTPVACPGYQSLPLQPAFCNASSARLTVQSRTRLTSITNRPPGNNKPHRVFCDHPHSARCVRLHAQVNLFKPRIVVCVRLWVLRRRPSGSDVRGLLDGFRGRLRRLVFLQRGFGLRDVLISVCPDKARRRRKGAERAK